MTTEYFRKAILKRILFYMSFYLISGECLEAFRGFISTNDEIL